MWVMYGLSSSSSFLGKEAPSLPSSGWVHSDVTVLAGCRKHESLVPELYF